MELTDKQVREIMGDVAKGLLEESRGLRLLSPTQTAAILDITTATLSRLPIPQVTLAPTSTARYRISDIEAYIEANRK